MKLEFLGFDKIPEVGFCEKILVSFFIGGLLAILLYIVEASYIIIIYNINLNTNLGGVALLLGNSIILWRMTWLFFKYK